MATFADYRAKSFWLEQSGVGYVENPALEGLIGADLLVVGGGLTGLSAACHFKQSEPGARVVLLESNVIGYGASGRSPGLVAAPFSLSLTGAARRFGPDRALEARRYMERAVAYVGELVERHQIDCDYENTGLLRIATNLSQAQRLQKEIRLAGSLGVEGVDWISAEAARQRVRSPACLGAWAESLGALVDPARLVRGLKDVAGSNGVEVYESTPVTSLELAPRVRAKTPRGAVESGRAVLAAGAFSSQFAQLRPRQAPLHTYCILTEPLSPPQLDAVGWQGRQGVQDGRASCHSFRLTRDNRLLVGGGDAYYFYGNQCGVDHHAPAFEHLERQISQIFPALYGVRITHRWGVPISATLDSAPVIGALGAEGRAVYTAGWLGHGIAAACLNGRALGDLALGRRTDLTETLFVKRATIPLPPEPLRALALNGLLAAARGRDYLDARRHARRARGTSQEARRTRGA